MTKITPFKTKVEGLFVEAPDDIRTYTMGIAAMHSGRQYILYDTESCKWDKRIFLPEGNYQLLGLSNELADEQKGMICECETDKLFTSVSQSFTSLMQSLNLTGTYAVLIKINQQK